MYSCTYTQAVCRGCGQLLGGSPYWKGDLLDALCEVAHSYGDSELLRVSLAEVLRDAASVQAAEVQDNYEFERGIIACLAVLNAHGYPHGSVIHDDIVRAADVDRIYAAAEDGDFEWAGLDLSRKPAPPQAQSADQESV